MLAFGAILGRPGFLPARALVRRVGPGRFRDRSGAALGGPRAAQDRLGVEKKSKTHMSQGRPAECAGPLRLKESSLILLRAVILSRHSLRGGRSEDARGEVTGHPDVET